jgi:hypothetical protein
MHLGTRASTTLSNRLGVRAFALLLLVASLIALPGATAASAASGGSNGSPADVRVIGAVSALRTRLVKVRHCHRRRHHHRRCTRHRKRVLDPRAVSIYKALIPKGIAPAHTLKVGIWLTEVSIPRSGNPVWTDQHWIEGAVMLRVHFGKEDGWYPIYYPVTSEFWFNAGRAVGLPKAHANPLSNAISGGWRLGTTSSTSGKPTITLDWRADANLRLSGDDQNLIESTSRGPFFVLNSAFQGPDIEDVRYLVTPPSSPVGAAPPYDPKSHPQLGRVDIRLLSDTDAEYGGLDGLPHIFPAHRSLSDLISLSQTLPATYRFNAIDLNSVSNKVGSGGYPPH